MPYGPQYGRHQLGAGREQPSNIDLPRILFLLAVDLHGWRPLARVFGSLAYERRRVSAGVRGCAAAREAQSFASPIWPLGCCLAEAAEDGKASLSCSSYDIIRTPGAED